MADQNKQTQSVLAARVDVRALNRRSTALVDAMIALFEQGQEPHHQSYPQHFGPADNRAAIAAYVQRFLKPRNPLRNRYGWAKGLFVEDQLSGYLLYTLSESDDVFYGRPRWRCYIEDIVVDAKTRGLGGASALMRSLHNELTPLGECAVSGMVWEGNAASQALFRKQGFEPLSQTFYKVIP